VVLGLIYLFPVIASALAPDWSRRLEQIGPMTAGLSIQATTGLRSLPLTPGRVSAYSPYGPPGRC
jgi:ABC-2 type transport system permease protein